MRGRSRRGSSGTAADFLVCFPPRAHLALMPPKTTCSPSRPSASSERRHSTSGRPSLSGSHLRAAAASRSRRLAAVDVDVDNEPSSPKVGCAGQIKVSRSAKPKAGAGGKAPKKSTTWMHALGIKKDALPFLNAFHGAFRLNVSGCFGRFPGAVVEYSSEDEDDEAEEKVERALKGTEHDDPLTKWFMVLEEDKRVPSRKKQQEQEQPHDEEEDTAPPANALMLMRCRSAPAKGLARRLGVDAGDDGEAKIAKKAGEEEEVEKENLVVMRYPPDFFHVSVDIAKETWIVGGDDSILRCRSWKK
ncbi:uncharacterized protein [Lolium perenne]|jgi:hypothetical protein|uniref:uncharacterized protein n=1 Tax=Lolium perenne TaxID=4522 RepID=UPI0021EA9055|nr:uncharacterized protein LOC127305798 [Lolium perenne]